MQLSEEDQKEIEERCAKSKAIQSNLKIVDRINGKIDRLLAQMVQCKLTIAITREKIVGDVTDKATADMRKEFIKKATKDKEIELFIQ